MQGFRPGTSPPPVSTPILVTGHASNYGAGGSGINARKARDRIAAGTSKDTVGGGRPSAPLPPPPRRGGNAGVGGHGPGRRQVPGRRLPLVGRGAGVDAGLLGRGHDGLVLAEEAKPGQLGPRGPVEQPADET